MLKGKNIYVVQHKNKLLASTVTSPVTIISFTNRNIAHRISESIRNTEFTIYPTMLNSYVVNIHTNSDNNMYYCSNKHGLHISEISFVYLGLLCNLNNVNVVLVNNINQTSDTSIILRCHEDETLPSVFTNEQMILGNLEKLILKDE